MKRINCIAILAAWAVTSPVIGEVTYDRVSLPPENNAWTQWATALAHLSRPKDEDIDEAFRNAYDFDKALPTGKAGHKLEHWLDSKKEHLDALSKGIAIGGLQFPPFSMDDIRTTDLISLRNAARIKIAKARYMMRDRRFPDAATECVEAYRMGQMILDGDGALIHYLVGVAVKSIGLNGIRHLADSEDVPPGVLEDILAKLPLASAEGPALAQTYRVELYNCIIPNLDKIVKSASDPTHNLPIAITNVLDKAATIKLAAGFFSRLVTNALSPWEKRDDKIEDDANAMLTQRGLDVATADDFLWNIAMSTFDAENEKAVKQWEQLGEIAKTHPNILGNVLVALIVPAGDNIHKRSVKVRVKTNLTRAYLGIRIYEKKNGHLPKSLPQLVSAGLLPQVPYDLFSGNPVLYSQQKRMLWSVGPDGEDHHGDKDYDVTMELPNK